MKDSDAGNGDSGSADGGGSSDGSRRRRSAEGVFLEEDIIRLACEEGFLFNSSSIEGDGVVEVAAEDQETEISMKGNGDTNIIVKPNGEKEVEIECLHTSEWSASPTCYLVQVEFECFITCFPLFCQCEKLDWKPNNVMEKVNLNFRGDLRGQGTIRTFSCKSTKSAGI